MQGFQCASREMTTAKVAMQNRDYPKAVEFLKQELANNPNNTEAMIALTETSLLVGDIETANKTFAELSLRDSIPEVKKRKAGLRNQIWTQAFNNAFNYYQKYRTTKDATFLDKSLNSIAVGSQYMPRIVDFYSLEGTIYELKNDQAKADEAYLKFVDNSKNEIDFVKNNQVYLNMTREAYIKKLGKPMKTTPNMNQSGDSTITDLFSVKGNYAYLFAEKAKGQWTLAGLRVNPPKDWLPNEAGLWTAYNTQPFGSLAANYYKSGNKDKALEYIKYLTLFEPTNADANTSMIQLYIDLGKKDDAVKEAQALTTNDPTNKVYWGQYGDLYMNLGDYDKAISQYEKALEIDPNYDFVIRNLASVYKNKASVAQQAEQERMDKDAKATINTTIFFPYLKKSAALFERSLKTERFRNDMDVLAELANIYLVLDDKTKLNEIVNTLESVEKTLPQESKQTYYLRLIKIYGIMKNNEKMKEAQEKYNEASK